MIYMNTLEIIRELEQDESLRATLRAVILGDELLSLPSEMRLLTAEVKKLAEAQLRTDETVKSLESTVKELVSAQLRIEKTVRELKDNVDRLNESVGETAEVSCALVLGAMAEERGWTVLDEPAPVAMDEDEVDVRGRFDTPDGEIVILVEAKSRLQKKYVDRWANRVGDKDWREKFLYPGFNGKVLPYIYGTLIYSGVNERAKERGIGVITYNGERLAPRPLR